VTDPIVNIHGAGAGRPRHLALSSLNDPEAVEYPDGGGSAAIGVAPGRPFADARMKHAVRRGHALGYGDGGDL